MVIQVFIDFVMKRTVRPIPVIEIFLYAFVDKKPYPILYTAWGITIITRFIWVPELNNSKETNPLKFYKSPDEDGLDEIL